MKPLSVEFGMVQGYTLLKNWRSHRLLPLEVYMQTVIIAIIFFAAMGGRGGLAAEPQAGQNGQHAGVETIKGQDGAPMILIPAGPFIMGSNDGLPSERPEHSVTLDSYYIDQYEVSMRLYGAFLLAAKHDAPSTWDDEAATTVGDRPAVGMGWADAAAYCAWAGKRLPTEAEWEKAARGTDGRRYPWGHMQPFVDIANYNRGVWVSEAVTLVGVAGGVEGMSVRHGLKDGGKSPYGLHHMAGNAAEWVSDWYDREYYAKSPDKNPTGPATGEKKVLRGGSWADLPVALRVSARMSAEQDFQDRTIGFRCAKDAK
jgi:sulfatase modifying factor 1